MGVYDQGGRRDETVELLVYQRPPTGGRLGFL